MGGIVVFDRTSQAAEICDSRKGQMASNCQQQFVLQLTPATRQAHIEH
jgi:hypothetical protein